MAEPLRGPVEKNRASMRITALVAGALFMEVLDATIIATAIPQMARSFHTGPVILNLGITVYLLTLAVFIPVSGWVTDRVGARTVFASAIAIFTAASGLCGISTTVTHFILMRILQGIGGAMMVPVGRLIVLRITPKDQLTEALTWITWPGLSALVIGPLLGGLITTYASWHWIFFVNLPLGAVALVLACMWVANIRGAEEHQFDWWTFVLGGIASAGVVFAMEELGADTSHWHLAAAIFVVSVVSGTAAVLQARRHPEKSLIAFDSMKLKTYAISIGGGSFYRIGVAGLPFLLTLMLQIGFGFSPLRAGLYLVIFFAGDLSMKAAVVPILRRWGFRNVILINGILTSVSMAACALLTPSTPFAFLFTVLFLHGCCRSLQFSAINSAAFADVDEKRLGRANSFLSAIMQLSSGMGVAVGAIVLRLFTFASGHLGAPLQLNDFRLAILVLALLALGPVIDGWGLAHDAGAATSGYRRRTVQTTR